MAASRPVSPCVHIVRPACYGISWYGALRGLGLVTKRRATHHSLHGFDHGESAAWQGGGSIRGTYIGLGSLQSGLFMHGPLKQYTTTPSPSHPVRSTLVERHHHRESTHQPTVEPSWPSYLATACDCSLFPRVRKSASLIARRSLIRLIRFDLTPQ